MPVEPSYKSFNINNDVKVKLTDKGLKIYRDRMNALFKDFYEGASPVIERQLKTDDDGYTTWQLWELMQIFGPHMFLGGENCFETNILIKGDAQ